MSEDNTFTQEQVNEQIQSAKEEWEKEALQPLQTELDSMKYKLPKEPTEEEQRFQQKQNDLWQREVNLTLQENGLSDFVDVIYVKDKDDLDNKVKSLNAIVQKRKVDNSYQPQGHKETDAYSQAKQKGDSQSMIKSIFGL